MDSRSAVIREGVPMRTQYFSKDGPLPPDFLSSTKPPADLEPMTIESIDFSTTPIPEYAGRYALVLDHVISPSECAQLLALAEASVDVARIKEAIPGWGDQPWQPAMVSAGPGEEVLDTTYRNSDRLIWDSQEVVDRIWARVMRGDIGKKLTEELGTRAMETVVRSSAPNKKGSWWRTQMQRWEFEKLNPRMRFLRYGVGQFFRPHCDGTYTEDGPDGASLSTLFTTHLYLNDSVAAVGEEAELVGGATSFVSNNRSRRVDVDPKAGRLLIFQQNGLYHAGNDVVEGIKYTMRTELMYKVADV